MSLAVAHARLTCNIRDKHARLAVVSTQDVGEGWWEGSVNGGEPGLLPASYVEVSDVPAGRTLHLVV